MKKTIALILTIAMAIATLTGCAGTTVVIGECTCPCVTEDVAAATEPAATEAAPEAETIPSYEEESAAEGAVKTGLAVSTNIADSTSATADAEGVAKYDITLAAVTVDDNGVIQSCAIDSVPAEVKFDNKGVITSDLTAPIDTKNEKGENYGMVAYGGAIAEWDAQVKAVADYAVGKTVEELKNGDIDMTTGKAKDGSDLSSSATIYLAGYVYAIEAAVNNAQHLGANAGDELVLTTMNAVDSSASADAENAGNAQLDATVAVVTRNNGVITSCYIDAVQAKVAFDATGTITTDLSAPVATKNELGENYGMVAWGGAIAEWNEQAAAYASYITGMTADEVAGIAVSETTKPADGSDLASSVTIAIGGFQALIAKTMQ